jgi:hypothetical protein
MATHTEFTTPSDVGIPRLGLAEGRVAYVLSFGP